METRTSSITEIAMTQRAPADPSRRKNKRLRDQSNVELSLGDVPDPDEG